MPILLADLSRHGDDDFDGVAVFDAMAGAALWMLRWSRSAEFIVRLLERADLLGRVLEAAGGAESFGQLLQYAMTVGGGELSSEWFLDELSQRLPPDAEAIMKTYAEELIEKGFTQGQQQGLARGREQGEAHGKEQGLRASIRDVIAARFGSVPQDLDSVIADRLSGDDLPAFLALAATAASIEDVRRALSARGES